MWIVNPIYDSNLCSLVSKAGLSLDSVCVMEGLLVARPLMWHSRMKGWWPRKALKWHTHGSAAGIPGSVPDKTFPLVQSEVWQTRTMWRGCVCTYVCMCVGCERDGHTETKRGRDRKRRQTWRWQGRGDAGYDASFVSESSVSGPLCSPYFEGLIYFIKQW